MGAEKSTPAPLKASSRATTSRRSAASRWYKSARAMTTRSGWSGVCRVHFRGVYVGVFLLVVFVFLLEFLLMVCCVRVRARVDVGAIAFMVFTWKALRSMLISIFTVMMLILTAFTSTVLVLVFISDGLNVGGVLVDGDHVDVACVDGVCAGCVYVGDVRGDGFGVDSVDSDSCVDGVHADGVDVGGVDFHANVWQRAQRRQRETKIPNVA